MRKIVVTHCWIVLLLVFITGQVFGWGFWAHKEINRRAIQLLPSEMNAFFHAHADYVAQHAVDPDLRRSRDSLEQYNHYLDIDHYGAYPFLDLPRDYRAAVARYGEDAVRKQGIVPWRIAWYTDSLTKAMKDKNETAILRFASELGHYVADSHVPLHAVSDYDGVQRGVKGIHKRWESDLTERYGQSYVFPVGNLFYIENPLVFSFQTILASYSYADSVFAAELRAMKETPGARSVKNIRGNGDTVYSYSDAYYESLRKYDSGLVERRLQKATVSLASYWYTAWVNAGKPELPGGKER